MVRPLNNLPKWELIEPFWNFGPNSEYQKLGNAGHGWDENPVIYPRSEFFPCQQPSSGGTTGLLYSLPSRCSGCLVLLMAVLLCNLFERVWICCLAPIVEDRCSLINPKIKNYFLPGLFPLIFFLPGLTNPVGNILINRDLIIQVPHSNVVLL